MLELREVQVQIRDVAVRFGLRLGLRSCLVLFRTGPAPPHHVVSDMSYDVILIMNFIMNFM